MRLGHLVRLVALLALLLPGVAHAGPVVIAVAAAYAGGAVATAVGAVGFAYFAVSAATSLAISAVGSSLFGSEPEARSDAGPDLGSFQAEARGRTQVVRSSVESRKRVYGQVMLSGPLVYAETTGTNNEYLHLIIPLAPHSVYEIGDIYFNDELVGTIDPMDSSHAVSTGRFAGFAWIRKHLGATDQAADQALISESASLWGQNHRLQGIAYIYVKLKYSQDVYVNGIPNIKALVKGCDTIVDSRDSSTGYTDNWALCVRDYLKAAAIDGGLEADDDEIDDTYFDAAANVCDELVTLADATTQARYTCNGTVDTAKRPVDILKDLMTGAAGVLTYPAGAFRVFPAAYTSPAVTLDEDDLRGPMQITARVPRRELFNAVRGTFSSPDNFWQPSDFPVVTNATYATNDGGEVIYRDIALPYTTHPEAAQRIAKIHLEKSRQGIVVQMPCKMSAFDLALWETVSVTNTALGWSSKVFRVTGWKLGAHGIGVDLVLREDTSASYDWSSGDATTVDAAPDTNLPSAWTVQVPGTPSVVETIYETTGSAGVKTRATASWAAAPDAFVVSYEAQYRPQGGTDWFGLAPVSLLTAQKDDLAPGRYEFRVRAVNGINVRSDWSATSTKELVGLTDPPGNVANAAISSLGAQQAEISFDATADLDVRIGGRVLWRWSPLTVGATWNTGVVVADVPGSVTAVRVPHLTGTYLGKFRDSSGNESITASSIVTTEPAIAGYNAITTLTEHSTFGGTKSSTVVVDGNLTLDTARMFDAATDLFDTYGYFDSAGGIASSGTYDFATVVDLAAVYTSRVTATLKALAVDTGDKFDERIILFDDGGMFDGADISNVNAQLFVATTPDDPSGSPTWSAWRPFFVGDYKARGLKFRLVLTSDSATENIQVQQLGVTVDMPDREDTARNITSGAGTYTVSYTLSPTFKALPQIGITAKDMTTGDYWQITSETVNGFDITFHNAGGASVSRTFDRRSVGY